MLTGAAAAGPAAHEPRFALDEPDREGPGRTVPGRADSDEWTWDERTWDGWTWGERVADGSVARGSFPDGGAGSSRRVRRAGTPNSAGAIGARSRWMPRQRASIATVRTNG